LVLVASAEDLPLGAVVCEANRQDASFTGEALASVVLPVPGTWPRVPVAPACPQANARRSKAQRRQWQQQWQDPAGDVRAMAYLRGDGNFAKVPARAAAKGQAYRLWAPGPGQSRRGLGRIRSSVERTHASMNQFGRIARRLDRDDRRYLAWAQLAACFVFMRRGFFP
jgi:transposase